MKIRWLVGAVFGGVASVSLVAMGANTQLYWGDTHLHTSYSFDAFTLGNASADPDTAYRFAKGLPVIHPGHKARVQIDRPLDFLVVSDHAEGLGAIAQLAAGNPIMLENERGRRWRQMLNEGKTNETFGEIVALGTTNPADIAFLNDQRIFRAAWDEITETADRHNDPGVFTAFIGWEWTSTPGGMNLHRIVVNSGDSETATKYLPFSQNDSGKPEDLWRWLADTSKALNTDFLTIGHNSNLSNGRFFATVDEDGAAIDAEYASSRQEWEPLIEVTQYKGDSETHPALSPDDEFADFERYGKRLDGGPLEHVAGSYARPALIRGLQIDAEVGVNPFKFGMIGATDSHTGLSAAEEDNFLGKYANDSTPDSKGDETVPGSVGWDASAMGFAGVWATENTRQGIFDAFKRREVFATTGPRIQLRFFGGWDYTESDAESVDFAGVGYSKGVPMGGDLVAAGPGQSPRFLIAAAKDPEGANLDRVQVIKGWVDADGSPREQIYDVAWSGNRDIAPSGRLQPVGNTVSLETGEYKNSIGTASLTTVWEDPDFDPSLRAMYYLRVLEIPTPRHTLFDTIALQQAPDTAGGHASIIQERAYSSPIWYTPR